MALFKIEKGLADDLLTNRPNAVEGYCYFTTDDGLFYIDVASGTLTGDNPTGNRVLLNAGSSAYANKAYKDINGNIFGDTYATKAEVQAANSQGVVPLFYYATITGDGSTTDFTVTHSLGLKDVIVQVYDSSTSETVSCDVVRTSVNAVSIQFENAPNALVSYRVLIYGLQEQLIADNTKVQAIPTSQKGVANGVATLDSTGKIPSSQLPSIGSSYKTTLTGDGTTTIFTITHNLESQDVLVQIFDTSDYEDVQCGVIRDNVNSLKIRFATAPASTKSYRILIEALAD